VELIDNKNLEKIMDDQEILSFMEPTGSLVIIKVHPEPYLEADRSSPHPNTLLIYDPF
jgi:hypothetical protein